MLVMFLARETPISTLGKRKIEKENRCSPPLRSTISIARLTIITNIYCGLQVCRAIRSITAANLRIEEKSSSSIAGHVAQWDNALDQTQVTILSLEYIYTKNCWMLPATSAFTKQTFQNNYKRLIWITIKELFGIELGGSTKPTNFFHIQSLYSKILH